MEIHNKNVQRKYGSGTPHNHRSGGSEEAELQVFGSQGRSEVRKRNLISLSVKAERKWGSGTSDIWQ